MPTINVQGVQARRDGDVIRVELPTDQIFQFAEGGANMILDDGGDALFGLSPVGADGHGKGHFPDIEEVGRIPVAEGDGGLDFPDEVFVRPILAIGLIDAPIG